MATTISNFIGQLPQIKRFESNAADLAALYRLDSDGSDVLGVDSMSSLISGGSISHSIYGVYSTCGRFIPNSLSSSFGASIYEKTNPTNWNYDSSGKTYMFWHKHYAATTYSQTLVATTDTGSTGGSIEFKKSTTGQYSCVVINNASSVSITFTSNTDWVNSDDGLWHHVCFVVTSGNSFQFYIDGVLHDQSSTTLGTTTTTKKANIGGLQGQIFGAAAYIDEVAVFDRGWSAQEVSAYGGGTLV